MAPKTALVVGVTGIIGWTLSRRLITEGWKVFGISRSKPDYLPNEVVHYAVDLTNSDSCKKNMADLTSVTHVFYTSWLNKGNEDDNCKVNGTMVANLIDNLPSKIKHFALVTGGKHYMTGFDAFNTAKEHLPPFKETMPRLPYANFYYSEEDVVFDRAPKLGFTWTVARPNIVIGFATRAQMNFGQALAVYASVCKHLNLPLIFPGTTKSFDVLFDCTDSELLAKHLIWEATDPKCVNQAFNVSNGDVLRWRHLWEDFADYFGVKSVGPDGQDFDLEQFYADKSKVWDEIVQKHGLRKTKLEDVANTWFVKVMTIKDSDYFYSLTKSRELGFNDYQPTEKSYFTLFDYLRKEKYIP